MTKGCGIILLDPKYAHNVGNALRAAACFGASHLFWTGDRVPPMDAWPEGARLPREERLRINQHVPLIGGVSIHNVIDSAETLGYTPICVERRKEAENLLDFVHPERAVYVFGPEDGEVPKGIRTDCHRFVSIPTKNDGPLNLAMAVNIVLYDRIGKEDH